MRYVYVLCAGLLIGLAVNIVISQDDIKPVDWQKWAEFHAPGEHHKWLAEDAGEWDISAKMWQPGADAPTEITGRSSMKMLFNRYLQEEYSFQDGTVMPGLGHIAYDNNTSRFKAVYMVNVGTDLPMFTGQRSEDGNSLTLTTEYLDRGMNDTTIRNRVVITRKGDNVRVKEVVNQIGDQPERKAWEMTYTRVE
jgi:hypothetical protein